MISTLIAKFLQIFEEMLVPLDDDIEEERRDRCTGSVVSGLGRTSAILLDVVPSTADSRVAFELTASDPTTDDWRQHSSSERPRRFEHGHVSSNR